MPVDAPLWPLLLLVAVVVVAAVVLLRTPARVPPPLSPPPQRRPRKLDASLAPVVLPVTDELDLHDFRPEDVPSLVEGYVADATAAGIHTVRIIHGEGKGTLRRTVHSVLGRLPAVVEFRAGGAGEGGWGATVARLRAASEDEPR